MLPDCPNPGWRYLPDERGEHLARLEALLRRVEYKEGWRFSLRQMRDFAQLEVVMSVTDSVTGALQTLQHSIGVPLFVRGDERELRRWLLERIFDIEKHEACEFLLIDGAAPFFPDHDRPYAVNAREEPLPITRRRYSTRPVDFHPWSRFPGRP